MKRQRNGRNLDRFVRRNLGRLAHACWLASAWQGSSADAEKDCDPKLAKELLKDQARLLRMEKTLRRYQANNSLSLGAPAAERRSAQGVGSGGN